MADPNGLLRVRSTWTGERVPVSVGVPFGRGVVCDEKRLSLRTPAGGEIQSQWEPLARWPDGSLKWALVDFVVGGESQEEVAFDPVVASEPRVAMDPIAIHGPVLRPNDGDVVGPLFRLPAAGAALEATVRLELVDQSGAVQRPRITFLDIERKGPVRSTLRVDGRFDLSEGRRLEFEARWHTVAIPGLARLDFTLRNPHAARHQGGLWDLGDPASIVFRDFSIRVALSGRTASRLEWRSGDGAAGFQDSGEFTLFQASSGGDNWRSLNHVNRNGEVTLPFRGWKLLSATGEASGHRAQPVVSLRGQGFLLSAAVGRFWQNFPKTIGAEASQIRLGLFPQAAGDLHELQGGEEKTHSVFVRLEPLPSETSATPLEWVHTPPTVTLNPIAVAETGAVPHLTPADADPPDLRAFVDAAVEGDRERVSLLAKRETIDEYGWRNFGDIYADHENTYYKGPKPVLSHYNNQYDLVLGLLIRYLRTGDARWLEVGHDLARHVADIDLYHTKEDKPSYNGGLFWHTDHYADALSATHRTYSAGHPNVKEGKSYGGGPSNEHNYPGGLALHYFLTGDPRSKAAAIGMAEWVHGLDDGRATPFGPIDPGPSGGASSTTMGSYHGPGRGAGNSVGALMDGFALTGERRHIEKAEELIRRTTHPRQDIAALTLEDLESRWSYVVYLQAIGRYLDLKVSLGELDAMYTYARESLLHFARWMLEHERPNSERLDQVEYPTETWPAHDIRKCVALGHAALHATGELRDRLRTRADYFRDKCLEGLAKFDSCFQTRPLAILLQSSWLGAGLKKAPAAPAPPSPATDFGAPPAFVPQKERVKRALRSPVGMARITARLILPWNAFRFVRGVLLHRKRS